MKILRKILPCVLVAALALSLCACGSKSSSESSDTGSASSESSGTISASSGSSGTISSSFGTDSGTLEIASLATDAPAAEEPAAAEEQTADTSIISISVNGVELTLGMTYADCMNALQQAGLTGDEFHFSTYRAGCTPWYLDDDITWIEGGGACFGKGSDYSNLDLDFAAPMPDDLDTDDDEAVIAVLEESGKLYSISIAFMDNMEASLGITECSWDGQPINSTTTGEELDTFTAGLGMQAYNDEEDFNGYYISDIINDHEFGELMVSCYYTDNTKTAMSQFTFEVDSEYFMAMVY